jgi:hypothetical protein
MICPSGHRKPRSCLNELRWDDLHEDVDGTSQGTSSTKEEQARYAWSGWGERSTQEASWCGTAAHGGVLLRGRGWQCSPWLILKAQNNRENEGDEGRLMIQRFGGVSPTWLG